MFENFEEQAELHPDCLRIAAKSNNFDAIQIMLEHFYLKGSP
jgi:hypothetical protein